MYNVGVILPIQVGKGWVDGLVLPSSKGFRRLAVVPQIRTGGHAVHPENPPQLLRTRGRRTHNIAVVTALDDLTCTGLAQRISLIPHDGHTTSLKGDQRATHQPSTIPFRPYKFNA